MLSHRIALCARGLRPFAFSSMARAYSTPAVALPTRIAAPQSVRAITSTGCMRLSSPRLAGLEDYYVSGQVATCIQSPMVYYVWFAWGFLMAFVTFGSLLHSNYYFSGRMLPKPSSNTQLLDD